MREAAAEWRGAAKHLMSALIDVHCKNAIRDKLNPEEAAVISHAPSWRQVSRTPCGNFNGKLPDADCSLMRFPLPRRDDPFSCIRSDLRGDHDGSSRILAVPDNL